MSVGNRQMLKPQPHGHFLLAIRRMHQSSKSPHHTLSDNKPSSLMNSVRQRATNRHAAAKRTFLPVSLSLLENPFDWTGACFSGMTTKERPSRAATYSTSSSAPKAAA